MSYYREAQIKDRLVEAGVRESDLEIFLIEHRCGEFDLQDITAEWLVKQRELHAIRFIGSTSAEDELYERAFVQGNITAQGTVVEQCGGSIAIANEIASRYGTKIGSTKKGTSPLSTDGTKSKAGKTPNPFADDTPGGEQRRIDAIRGLGAKAAASLAASCSPPRDIAGRPLKRRVA